MKKTLSSHVTLCRSVWKQGTGLMFRRKRKDFAWIFLFSKELRIRITMWFVLMKNLFEFADFTLFMGVLNKKFINGFV